MCSSTDYSDVAFLETGKMNCGLAERLKLDEISLEIKIVLTFLDHKENYISSSLNWQVGNSKIVCNI